MIIGSITIQPDGQIVSSASLSVIGQKSVLVQALTGKGVFNSSLDMTVTTTGGECVPPTISFPSCSPCA